MLKKALPQEKPCIGAIVKVLGVDCTVCTVWQLTGSDI